MSFPDLQFQGLSGGVADDVDAAPEAGGLESGLEVRERCANVQADVPELGAQQVEYPVAACGPRESICRAHGSGGDFRHTAHGPVPDILNAAFAFTKDNQGR